ncbi:MAG TPA: DMT family transporter, partial [Anaerolineae bacterium]|nr:DMT family transporter [Anaerolineae bacterium]
IASIALLPLYLARRSKFPPMPRRVLGLAALGGFFFALDVWTWQSSLTYASAASATLLGNTSSIIVALGAWLIFHEKLRLPFWTGLLIAFAGVLLVLGADILTPHASDAIANVHTEGNLLALLGAFFYAGYLLTTQHTRVHLDTVAYLFLMSAIGALILLGITLIQGDPLWGFSINAWLALLGLALITHVIGWLAISYALGHIRASIVSVTLLGQPVLTALFSIPILGEGLIPLQIIGGLLVLSGIYIVNRFGR